MPIGDLAELSDVAIELGLTDETALSENQAARATSLISRVSYLFNREAQRLFLPGQDTVRLKVVYRSPYSYFTAAATAYVWLTEVPSSVENVQDDVGNIVPLNLVSVVGHELRLLTMNYPRYVYAFYGGRYPFAEFVTVTYTHEDPIPVGVTQCVASIVARYLALVDQFGVTTTPAASELQAGGIAGYRARFADWANKGVQLMPEDIMTARSYRYPAHLPVVAGT